MPQHSQSSAQGAAAHPGAEPLSIGAHSLIEDRPTYRHPTLRLSGMEWAALQPRLESLTAREREVVRSVCIGGTNEAIAARLHIAPPTLRTHLSRLHQKLGCTSKSDLIRWVASRVLEGYRAHPESGNRAGESPQKWRRS